MKRLAVRFALALALVVALFAPRVASADERLRSYELDITPADASNVITYRLRLEYLATGPLPKKKGFKYFGTPQVEHWTVTDDSGASLGFVPSRESSSGEERLDFDVPPASSPGATQVVVVEIRQPAAVVCGFTHCSADVSWAHKFKIPVDRMIVRVHGERAQSDFSFACTGSGDSKVCTRDTAGLAELSVPLRKDYGMGDVLGAFFFLIVGGAGTWLLLAALRGRRRKLLQLRGVIPPTPEPIPAYPQAGGYRAPAVIPVAAAAEPELAPEDAASQKTRTRVVWGITAAALLLVAVGVPTRLPMTFTMGFAAVVVFGFETIYARLEKGGTWLAIAPALAGFAALIGGPIIGLGGVVLGVAGHLVSIAPPGTFQGSGSSSSSCGGGGGGGGCGGGGGGGGGGCGG